MSRTTIYKYINDGSLLVVHPNSSQRGVRVPATSIIRFAEAAEKRAREDALAKAGELKLLLSTKSLEIVINTKKAKYVLI